MQMVMADQIFIISFLDILYHLVWCLSNQKDASV